MRVSMMVRRGALIGVATALAACTESPNAPARPGIAAGKVSYDRQRSGDGGSDHRQDGDDYRGDHEDGNKMSVTVDPTVATTVRFGNHVLYFPANSICDPATSGYGEQLWNAPCAPLTTPIVISATWTDKMNNHAAVDFQPALRFVPSNDPSGWVLLSLKDQSQMAQRAGNSILWLRPADKKWVNEGLMDASMSSSTDLGRNTVSRRIKHFSGYNLATGLWEDTPVDGSLAFLGW
jgi:hypothetical protein